MKTVLIKTPRMALFKALLAAMALLLVGTLQAQTTVKPRPAPAGTWTLIGTTVADYSIDHDSIIVKGKHDNFSKIKFKVTEAPLNLHRLVVTYDNGEPDEVSVPEII